jgi:hypothetical protein
MSISLLEHYLAKKIPQNLLLTESGFRGFLEERGLRIRSEDLESFEEWGLLYPLCRLKLPFEEQMVNEEKKRKYAMMVDISHTLTKWHQDGYCEDPTKTKFRPWKEYKDGFWETAPAFYHPLQALTIKTIQDYSSYRFSIPSLLDESKLTKLKESVKSRWKSEEYWIEYVANEVKKDLQFFPLFISIEDIFLPSVRSTFIGSLWETDHGESQWARIRKEFDPKATINKFGLTETELKAWRENLVSKARADDPLKNWYLLVRNAKYSKRQKIAYSALFAQDLYDEVEVLNLFLKELTGKPQLEADDLFDSFQGEWKTRFYGGNDFENREILRNLVYEYGLDYDYKLLLFLEGETEVNSIPKIAEALGLPFPNVGVRVEKLGGYSEIKPDRIEKLLKYSHSSGIVNYIIIDNHEFTKKYVTQLIEKGNLGVDQEHIKIWEKDFEEDNFSVDELTEAATRLANKEKVTLTITKQMFNENKTQKPDEGNANILIDMCEEQQFNLSKSKPGEELGLMVAERIVNGKAITTKIEEEIIKIVRLL